MSNVVRLRPAANAAPVETGEVSRTRARIALMTAVSNLGTAQSRLSRVALTIAARLEGIDPKWLPSAARQVPPGGCEAEVDEALSAVRAAICSVATVSTGLAHAVDLEAASAPRCS
jgi:hypothetical protein